MDLFKKYHTIEPEDFPDNWLGNDDFKTQTKLKEFIRFGFFHDFSTRNRLEKLIKKTIDEYLEPVKKNKYYRMVSSMTIEELDSMQDLSHKQYKQKFFGLMDSTDVKIRLKGEDIVPHVIREFSKMELEEIHPSFLTALIDPETKIINVCTSCGGDPHTTTMEKNPQPRPQFQNWMNQQHSADESPLDDAARNYRNYSENIEVTHTCSTCKGHGSVGFTFEDFKKYVEKYNKKIEKENKKTSEINEKAQRLVEEYNQTIEVLNEKIKIWNSKCPSNALDKSYEGNDDVAKYFV